MGVVDRLQKAGYSVGVASGDVAREEDALAVAQAAAEPSAIEPMIESVVRDVVQKAIRQKLGDKEIEALGQRAAVAAADAFESDAAAEIAFRERALEHARSAPTVYCVQDPEGGERLRVYVAVDDETGEPIDEHEALAASLLDNADAHLGDPVPDLPALHITTEG